MLLEARKEHVQSDGFTLDFMNMGASAACNADIVLYCFSGESARERIEERLPRWICICCVEALEGVLSLCVWRSSAGGVSVACSFIAGVWLSVSALVCC
jgi:hypothetical protein